MSVRLSVNFFLYKWFSRPSAITASAKQRYRRGDVKYAEFFFGIGADPIYPSLRMIRRAHILLGFCFQWVQQHPVRPSVTIDRDQVSSPSHDVVHRTDRLFLQSIAELCGTPPTHSYAVLRLAALRAA